MSLKDVVRSFVMDQLVYIGFNSCLDGRYPCSGVNIEEQIKDAGGSEAYLNQWVDKAVDSLIDHKEDIARYVALYQQQYSCDDDDDDDEEAEIRYEEYQKLRYTLSQFVQLPIWKTLHLDSSDIFYDEFLPTFLTKVDPLLN
jgi:hypothetical protein